MLVATLGVAALAPALIAQSLPTNRRPGRDGEEDGAALSLLPHESPALVVVENEAQVAPAAVLPTVVQIDDERADRASGNAAKRAERKANRQAVRRAGGAPTAAVVTDQSTAATEAVPASAVAVRRSSAQLTPEEAAARTARRAQRKAAGAADAPAAGQAVVLSVPELPPGESSQGAMLEHVAKLSISLNQAHRLIHTLSVEKLDIQKELAILKNEPVPETITLPRMGNAAGARADRTARQPRTGRGDKQRGRQVNDEASEEAAGVPDAVLFMEAKQVARKRQMMALGVISTIAFLALAYNYLDWHWFPNIGDRQALGQLAYIGGFVQIFFMGWMFFRFARIGGKGARWLFPSEEEQIKQVRRKKQTDAQKAQIRQIKESQGTAETGPTAPQRDASHA